MILYWFVPISAKMAQLQATQQPPPTLIQPAKEESPQLNGHVEETPMETSEQEVIKEVSIL